MENRQDQIDLLNGRISRLKNHYGQLRIEVNDILANLSAAMSNNSYHEMKVTENHKLLVDRLSIRVNEMFVIKMQYENFSSELRSIS